MSVSAHNCVVQVTNMTFLPALEATTGIPTGISTDFTKPFISQLKINGAPHLQPDLFQKPYRCLTASIAWRAGLPYSPFIVGISVECNFTLEDTPVCQKVSVGCIHWARPGELRSWIDRIWCGS